MQKSYQINTYTDAHRLLHCSSLQTQQFFCCTHRQHTRELRQTLPVFRFGQYVPIQVQRRCLKMKET